MTTRDNLWTCKEQAMGWKIQSSNPAGGGGEEICHSRSRNIVPRKQYWRCSRPFCTRRRGSFKGEILVKWSYINHPAYRAASHYQL